MKKYFAKYLPVEGEIQEGDYYFNKEGKLCRHGDWGITKPLSTHKKIMGWKKVKLFLCSHDIQVGDNCYSVPRNWYFKADSQTLKAIENDETGIIRVIGEISPDALSYVKEGDEYLFGKVDKNSYIYPYNKTDEKSPKLWSEEWFRNLPDI